MKRLFILPVIFFILCGCSKSNEIKPILNNISFDATITYKDLGYVGKVNLNDDALNLILSSPNEINGLTLNISKSAIVGEFKGISYEYNASSLTNDALPMVLFDVIMDLSDKKAIYNDKNCKITGKINNYEYIYVFSPSGLPLLLKIDDIDLQIEFSNVVLN